MELLGDEFFAPASTSIIGTLIAEYNDQKHKIDALANLIADSYHETTQYFLTGNNSGDRYTSLSSAKEAFKREGAVAALNSAYWSKTLKMTDVFDCMPEKRRKEWVEMIRQNTCLDFTTETVRPTIETLLSMRAQFFGERVDGIFRNLSGLHVTNSPMGFGKRMIISYMTSYYGDKTGHINDLRCVIAKFMGRDQPEWYQTSNLVRRLGTNTGVWFTIDGGALRIKLFKKGTAHLEVHPDMAWKLNATLSSLYPNAIPSEFRTKPKKQDKSFAAINRPVPFLVLKHLVDGGCKGDIFTFNYGSRGNAGYDEAVRIIQQIGGVPVDNVLNTKFKFEYDIKPVMENIIDYGCLPDSKSHQYYPTPENIAKYVVEIAGIEDHHTVLEPSAGQGHIASHIPNRGQVTCVELSKLHVDILTAKDFNVIQDDFLIIGEHLPKYDRIIMNPPFSDGRWLLHLKAAIKRLKPNGKLIAILPASTKNHKEVFGTWHKTFTNEFDNTSVSVSVLEIRN